jgi:hypothetical protein
MEKFYTREIPELAKSDLVKRRGSPIECVSGAGVLPILT